MLLAILVSLCDRLSELKRGLRHADVSHEKAALYTGSNKGSLSRALNDDGGISVRKLAQLPDDVWRWWAVEVLLTLGLPKQLQRTWRMVFALLGQKRRMAQMDAASVQQKRSA